MIGKWRPVSYGAVRWRYVRRRCPKCKKMAQAERVDYGPGGVLIFCECGDVRKGRRSRKEPKKC